MATYLSGVTDYIPQYQPFQPDLNFYDNIMHTKQTQYDNNWKSLNKMYSTYYNAELTGEDNIEKKDNYLKQIEFNLKRVSQLDLSLEQNVEQATQIFKPFYEDKGLMKDMAYTKNYMRQVNYGESLKNAYDVKEKEQYWDTGIAALHYQRQEFKEASNDERMSFQNPTYTPKVDINGKATQIAKELDIDIETPSFSEDGRFIIKTKGGVPLLEPLRKLFEARLGSDPGVQDFYKTQAYVDRKSYADINAAQFNGDKKAAEMKYLEDSYNILKAQNVARYDALRNQSISYDARIKDIQSQIDKGNALPEAQNELAFYKANKEINDKILAKAEEEQKLLSSDQKTATTSTGFVNPYGDIKSLRHKVDSGMASMLMAKDLNEAADIYVKTHIKQTTEVNPFALEEQRHSHNVQIANIRNQGLINAAKLRNQAQERSDKLASGKYYENENGEVVPVEALNSVFMDMDAKNTATGTNNMKDASRLIVDMHTRDIAMPYLDNTLALLERLVSSNKMSVKDASKILSYTKNPNIKPGDFKQKYQKYGADWLRNEVGTKDLKNIQARMNSWINKNPNLTDFRDEEYAAYNEASINFNDYTNYLKEDTKWRKKSSVIVENALKRDGFLYTGYLYDENGRLRSESEFYNAIPKEVKDQYSHIYAKTSGVKEPLLMGTDGEDKKGNYKKWDKALDYKQMVKAAGQAYSRSELKIPPPIQFSKYGEMSGSGNFTLGVSSTFIDPSIPGTKSRIWANEAFKDISNIDWYSTDKNRISFNGISKESFKNADGNADLGKAFMTQLYSVLSDPKNKMSNFKVSVAPIAMGSVNKAAIIIHPDADWLKKFVRSKSATGKDTGTGYLTQEQYNDAIVHGISFITDASSMTNSMYKNAFSSPLESYINAGNTYEYTGADPRYKLTISQSKLGTGDYMVKTEYPFWNPDLNKYTIESDIENTTNFGNQIFKTRAEQIAYLNSIRDLNIYNYNQ